MLPGIEQVLFTHGIVLGIQTLLVIYDSLSIRAILENEGTCLDREEGAFWSGMQQHKVIYHRLCSLHFNNLLTFCW